MKVVVDTNVLVSGIFWKGAPRRVLEAWADNKFKLVASSPILSEYQRVIQELGSRYQNIDYERILELINVHAEIFPCLDFFEQVCRDRNDEMFLGTAISANAKVIVSGDKDLLTLGSFKGIKILTASTFITTFP